MDAVCSSAGIARAFSAGPDVLSNRILVFAKGGRLADADVALTKADVFKTFGEPGRIGRLLTTSS